MNVLLDTTGGARAPQSPLPHLQQDPLAAQELRDQHRAAGGRAREPGAAERLHAESGLCAAGRAHGRADGARHERHIASCREQHICHVLYHGRCFFVQLHYQAAVRAAVWLFHG